MAEPSFAFGDQWEGRCFTCGATSEYRTDNRLCPHCVKQYWGHHFFEGFKKETDLASCFVTILPEAKHVERNLLRSGFNDLFLGSSQKTEKLRPLLKKAFRRVLKLPCGQPVLSELPYLAQFAGLGRAWTLDLSPCIWSGTHKDLRSWAVLSVAIEQKINHLALWTAGNAGSSLAKLVHRWNATVSANERKTVYCLMDAFASSEMMLMLRSLQCKVAPISGSGSILSREQLYQIVASMAGELDNYWQVTDGWDGVGIFMYSLMAQQCLHFLHNELDESTKDIYVVLPLGTANLLLGFVRGIDFMEYPNEEQPKIVAAVPYGDHMMVPFLPPQTGAANGGPRVDRVEPEAPKITGFYSPLSPCLWKLAQSRDFSDRHAVEFIDVDRADQIEAGARVLAPSTSAALTAEPSALIAFGALKQLAQRIGDHGKDPGNSVVLVVNSGFGIVGQAEREFYEKSIMAFR